MRINSSYKMKLTGDLKALEMSIKKGRMNELKRID